GQWSTELRHVTPIIGGVESQEKYGGQAGVRFTPVSKERQKAAVKFLNENAFRTPTMFLKPEILRRIEPAGALARMRTAQLQVLTSLMEANRFRRLVELEAIDGAASYRPSDFLADVRQGIFSEMYDAKPQVDAYRRNLQRAYLDLISTRLNGPQRATDDQRPMLRGELQTIAADATIAIRKTTDRDTRLHLEDLRSEIAKILDPKFQQANPVQAAPQAPPVTGEDGEFCWPDNAIR